MWLMLRALLLALAVPARARSRCARTSPPATASAMALSGGRARSIGRGTNSRGARNCSASVLQKAARLEFKDARYAGTKDSANQGFIMWDAGSYRVESDDLVMIQTASDAQELYRYRFAGDRLSFTDGAGCEFVYQREPDTDR